MAVGIGAGLASNRPAGPDIFSSNRNAETSTSCVEGISPISIYIYTG